MSLTGALTGSREEGGQDLSVGGMGDFLTKIPRGVGGEGPCPHPPCSVRLWKLREWRKKRTKNPSFCDSHTLK